MGHVLAGLTRPAVHFGSARIEITTERTRIALADTRKEVIDRQTVRIGGDAGGTGTVQGLQPGILRVFL